MNNKTTITQATSKQTKQTKQPNQNKNNKELLTKHYKQTSIQKETLTTSSNKHLIQR